MLILLILAGVLGLSIVLWCLLMLVFGLCLGVAAGSRG